MIELQEIFAYTALLVAVGFLVRKFFFKRKKKKDSCGGPECGC